MSTMQWMFFWIWAIPAGFGLLAAMVGGILAMGFAQDDSRNTSVDYVIEGFLVWLLCSLAAIFWPVYVPAEIYRSHS